MLQNEKIYFQTVVISLLFILASCGKTVDRYSCQNTAPNIFPDYSNVVIPVNIAPLNFIIRDSASKYHVEIYSAKGKKIIIHQTSPKIQIPLNDWKKLLSENTGQNFYIDVYAKKNEWIKYESIKDSIVADSIDSHLVYRLINAAYILWRDMGIYQRNLENFEKEPIFVNTSSNHGCLNCHMFCRNDPKKMTMHFRKEFGGTMILDGETKTKINTKTPNTISACAYPSWHPNGELIAYSVNIINQDFRAEKEKAQDVWDSSSDLVVYNIKTNVLITSPKISTSSRENLPTWSPDGKYLYFINAPQAMESEESNMKIKYDLMRIAYDPDKNLWGQIDTVLSSKKTGMSITFPVISPDGKFLLFCMIDYGYFSIYHMNSDLYILDLASNEYRKLDVNSTSNESYHCWSSSGRWITISSKRMDNVYSRPYFAYFDANGKEYKPFLMPQKDPEFYDTFMKNFNRPELVKGKVELDENEMRDFVREEAEEVNSAI